MNAETPLLEISDLYFAYPHGDYVLRGLNFTLSRGEHVLIIGDTGSGKTTLARVITKVGKLVYQGRLSGSIRVLGREIDKVDLEFLTRVFHVVGQNPYAYFTEPLVYDNLLSYALKCHGHVERAKRAVEKAVEATGTRGLLYRYFYELSGGEARRVLVARALVPDPLALIFDEPLMWLDDQGVNDFLDLLGLLKSLGKSVLVFEHRFLPLVKHVDKIYLLTGGKLREVTDMVYRLLRAQRAIDPKERVVQGKAGGGRVLLELRNVQYAYGSSEPILRGVNLEVREGDSALIYGLNGCGKTTLLKIAAGYLKPKRGVVNKYANVMYIPQNIILFYTEEAVEKEVREICVAKDSRSRCVEEGIYKVRELGIDPEVSPFNLSHGQMVKLAITLASIAGARVLLLDEPFSGLTYSDRLKLLDHLKKSNVSFILTTSTLDAFQEGMWTRAYKLESGVLFELGKPMGTAENKLRIAAQLYEALRSGPSY